MYSIEKISQLVGYNMGCLSRLIESVEPNLGDIFDKLRNISLVIQIIKIYNEKNVEKQTEYQNLLKQIVATNVFNTPKQFVIKMEFHPQNRVLSMDCMTHQGVFTKLVDLDNVIPATYEDYVHFDRRKLFRATLFLDTDMILFNNQQQEFYIFDKDSQWNEEGINHPELTLDKLYNEKKWFDQLRII
ncbi:hypothetical protein IMG5_071980 [Ichthyophthirius multifiliis]|uniref:Uncharacterized protein n=1 Tax=Ichthyophthirius multifiliis TaxID=5932 RepID=G0QPW7_ICHMU|nr:hypothetical protein IMG5_071980 [Ichthyophthirius multifiliis]EGR32745.1 hypothetical protein IMG5_071980 [Ichthyophthirius multifiliis]|eukprot:XP_004036731.1 hypothetical protein IMG5_071980 [Ichthyophthirius multifiliis]